MTVLRPGDHRGVLADWRAGWHDLRREAARRGPVWTVWQVVLTAAALWLIAALAAAALRWVVSTAEWGAVAANLRLFAVGSYPQTESWRVAAALALVLALVGFSGPVWGALARDLARLVAGALAALTVLPWLAPFVAGAGNGELATLLAAFAGATGPAIAALAACAAGWVLGRAATRRWGESADAARLSRYLRLAWLVTLAAVGWLLRGGGGLPLAEPDRWGGLLLTLALATASIALSFPLGVLLALGRRSGLPLVRWICVGVIELVRGVPLVTVLYMVGLVVPLVVADAFRPGDVARAVLGLTVFTAAYVAEDVRGGLAAVGGGQYEAARALGLGPIAMYRRVILPQALRAVVPAMVGQFISLFKNTALAIVLGLRELLGIARAVANQPEFIGTFRETLVFVSIVFFVISFGMSRSSRHLERRWHAAGRGNL